MLNIRAEHKDEGVTLTEVIVTVVILSLIMTVLFQWLVSSQNVASATVQRGHKESELLLVHELISRDVRSARHLNDAIGSSAVERLTSTRIDFYVDRDLDGIPNLVVWELTAGVITRNEFPGQAGTGPSWLFDSVAVKSEQLVDEVTSPAIFSAWSRTQGVVSSCDASVNSLLCQLGRLDVSVEAAVVVNPQSTVELVSSYTFRIEGL